MSHRTKDLPPASGLVAVVRELRYHEVSRQLMAVVLLLLYTLTATPEPWLMETGLVMGLLGMLVRLHASGFVLKNKELATNGPYALMRHPLYTGNILLVLGFALAGSALWAIPVALVFFWFYYPPAIEYEDRKLHSIFGEQWETWSKTTPALVPNLANFSGLFSGQWSFRKSTWKNGELFIAIYIVCCATAIWWRQNAG